MTYKLANIVSYNTYMLVSFVYASSFEISQRRRCCESGIGHTHPRMASAEVYTVFFKNNFEEDTLL